MDELLRQAKRLVMTAENALKSKDEKKWHTRRVMNPQPKSPDFCSTQLFWAPRQEDIDRVCTLDPMEFVPATIKIVGSTLWATDVIRGYVPSNFIKYASYQIGDLCWIAEPYQIKDEPSLPDGKRHIVRGLYGDQSHFSVTLTEQETAKFRRRKYPYRYTAGRFMYKSLARTIVEIKRVWAEQVQNIDIEDAIAEGYPLSWANAVADGLNAPQAIEWFHELWNSINKARGFGWDVNPWVYAYEYELVKKLRQSSQSGFSILSSGKVSA